MHTTWSDGGYSIREMVEACRAKGYSHMVITDHTQYLKIANGLTPERLREQIAEIRMLNKEYDDIEIFCGCVHSFQLQPIARCDNGTASRGD